MSKGMDLLEALAVSALCLATLWVAGCGVSDLASMVEQSPRVVVLP